MALYRCAVCGSSRVVLETRQEGYNKKQGIFGMALFGLGGAVAGAGGNEVVYYHCVDCGHTLNRCMYDFDKESIDKYLQEPTKSGNVYMLRNYKKQYPNIEWEEPEEYTAEILRQERLKEEKIHEIVEKIRQQNIPADIAILNALYNSEEPLTVWEMEEKEPSYIIYSMEELTAKIERLCEKKIIIKVEKNSKTYYKAIPDSKDEAIKMAEDARPQEEKIELWKATHAEELEKIRQNIPADIAILNALYNSEEPLTIVEMRQKELSCMAHTVAKLFIATRRLCEKKVIIKVEKNSETYFKAIPDSKDEAIKMLKS